MLHLSMVNVITLWLGTISRLFRARRHPRPQLTLLDKVFRVATRQVWSDWKWFLIVVLPETLVHWHQAGFPLYWRILSKVLCVAKMLLGFGIKNLRPFALSQFSALSERCSPSFAFVLGRSPACLVPVVASCSKISLCDSNWRYSSAGIGDQD
jgi:hypothetical protein